MLTFRERLVDALITYGEKVNMVSNFDIAGMADYIIEYIDELYMYRKPRHTAGDKVIIRKNMCPEVKYGGFTFREEMCDYCGKEATITNVDIDENIPSYNIDVDEGYWHWNDSMLEDQE